MLSTPSDWVAPGLTRTPEHVYSWVDKTGVYSPIPSVTSVIRLIDKSGPLMGWARRTVAEIAVRNVDTLATMRREGGDQGAIDWLKGLPGYQRDRAADRGSQVHQIVEQIIRGQSPEVPEELGPYVAAYHAFVKEWQPEYIASEQMVCSLRWSYAGTFDAIAKIGNERWLCDWKTSSGVYSETALQLVAYGNAEFIGRPGDATKYRVPKVTRYGVVHIVPEGAELVPYMTEPGAVAEAWAAFRHALPLHRWVNGPAKTVVGKPLGHSKETAA